jgi:hypothetical protein
MERLGDAFVILTLTLVHLFLMVVPVRADKSGTSFGQGGNDGSYAPIVYRNPDKNTQHTGLRAQPDGQTTIIVLVGNSDFNSGEGKYGQGLAAITSGTFFAGNYNMDHLVTFIVSEAKAGRKIANIYLVGHIVCFPDSPENRTELAKTDPNLPPTSGGLFGFLQFGASGAPVPAKFGNVGKPPVFIAKLEKALKDQGLTPEKAFAADCRIVFRVCSTVPYMADFFTELAKLLPAGGEVVAYDTAYVWATSTPLQRVYGGNTLLFDEQVSGRKIYKAKVAGPSLTLMGVPSGR